MTALPYWRMSSFYFWYFAVLGAFAPYFARWLHELGLGAVAVGALMAMWYGSRVVAPSAWSVLCTRSQAPHRWLQVGTVAMALAFGGFLFARSFWSLLLVLLAFGFFANAIMPQFEAMTLTRLGPLRARYGRVRVWGSLGFLLVALGYGELLDRVGNVALPMLVLPLLAATVLSALAIGAAPPAPEVAVPRLREVLRRGEVRRFLLVVLLMQVGFGPFYVFYTIHLGQHGHGGGTIGALWALGVLAEMAVLMLMPRWLARWDAGAILRLCLLVTVLRWAAVALAADNLATMLAAQLVHALSFGAFHAASMQRVTEYFPGRLGQHGQGLLYGFSSGTGGVLGALLAGAAFDFAGGQGAFAMGAGVCVLAFVIASSAQRPQSAPS